MTTNATLLQTICILLSGVAIVASEVHADPDADTVTLLQGLVQEKSRSTELDENHASEYNLADSPACTKREAAAQATPVLPQGRLSLPEHSTAALSADSETGDSCGAGILRGLLQLALIVFVCDALRRRQNNKQKDIGSSSKDAIPGPDAGWVAMVEAASQGDEAKFEKALEMAPSVVRTDTWGCTPLHFAAVGGSAAIAKELLKMDAAVDAVDASDETPLHFAARSGHVPICETLLGAGANIDALNVEGFTPLVIAGQANQERTCRLLADRGAGVAGLAEDQLPPLVVSQTVRKIFAA